MTADGTLVRADETQNTDLLWGLRGGGGNFGVVTQFEFALHPVGPIVYAGPIFYPADVAGDLLRLFREWAPGAPDDFTALVNLTTAPPLPVIPEAWHGKKVAALIAASAGSPDAGAAQFGAFRDLAEPVADLLGPMPYTMIQSLIDPLWPKGIQRVLQGDEPVAPRRRADRHAHGPPPGRARAAVRDPRPPDGRRGGARRAGRDGVRRALDAVRAERRDRLARHRGAGSRTRDWARNVDRRRDRRVDGPRLLELPRRPGRRAGRPTAPRRTTASPR